jgi:hypothetical protein
MPSTKSRKTTNWKDSKAKTKLIKYINKGKVTEKMKPRQVYQLHPEFQKFKYDRFRDNLCNLKKSIKKLQSVANRDAADLANDLVNRPPRENAFYWPSSGAKVMLLNDIAAGRHLSMTPGKLWESNDEYKQMSKKQFRDRLYKEVHAPVGRAYWGALRNEGVDDEDSDIL